MAPGWGVLLRLGSPDLGQGLATTAEQIVAEALGIPYESGRAVDLDTDASPNGGVTCASRMTYLVGNSAMMAARQLIDALPTAEDIPATLESVILEIPEASGPYGVKGVGEMGLVPTAPAIANAVCDAVGVRARSLPITPDVIAQSA